APAGPEAATARRRPRPRPSDGGRRAGPGKGSVPAAPRSGGATAPSSARSRRSRRSWPPAVALFFDARPVGFQPGGDRRGIALAGDALRLLRAEPPVAQPGGEIPRVQRDV